MDIKIKVKTENLTNQIENLTVNYSPWIFSYEQIGKSWVFTYENENYKKRTKTITLAHLAKGMSKLATEDAHRFGSIVTGDTDALDADALIQCTIFGKLVYA